MPSYNEQVNPGAIIPGMEPNYLYSKMLDHSEWKGLFRDHIMPSDLDIPGVPLCLDNRGAIIFADLSISYRTWIDVDKDIHGQRMLYEALIKHGPHCSVICKHSVSGRIIKTLSDIESFQVMLWDFEPVLSQVYLGSEWKPFCLKWVNEAGGPLSIRRRILGLSTRKQQNDQ